jgi:hypothetical protein
LPKQEQQHKTRACWCKCIIDARALLIQERR